MNKIVINFTTCSPAPSNGYKVFYRVEGSADSYIEVGPFYSSPAIFYDDVNPPGTCYEGYIATDCGNNVMGNHISFETCGSELPPEYEINLVSPCIPGITFSSYIISNGIPGDVVTVRATFNGLLQKTSGLFTRADMSIIPPSGPTQNNSSPCYSDTGPHGFSIFVETTITMSATTETVNLIAVINNGSESATSVSVIITDVNGVAKSISEPGCRGNSSTGGTC